MRWPRARRAVIPVLRLRDVRHPPIVAVPAVEAIHAECPEAGVGVADDDQAVRVPDLHAEGALHDARAFPLREATESRLVLALAGVIPADRPRVGWIDHVEDLQAVLVRRHEHERPTDLVVV